ncbi:sulfotransferase [Ilyomonas limi]|uniref:Sulfotransferase n=1 Tax=Ilyomonas limi TaxID=2575867 RepID=A0A4U3L194_9BACT|nr:sulfotransferase [Ilyomonas limi]TKK67964.1 sulfotransferase [Ilyomonas limi]
MRLTAVQMIGTQRSGSNLLRLMLNQLPQVSAPHPPHILERFVPLLPLYGNLLYTPNFRKLVTDVCQLVACNPVPWQHAALDVDRIVQRCEAPTIIEIARVMYEEKARDKNASIWICKSMSNIHYAQELEASLQPLYIFLYRDGRDVACSFKKAVVGEKHIYNIAKQWKEEQDKCIALQQYVGNERCVSVCYEQLIANPEEELRKIGAFIGAEYDANCLLYYRSEEAKSTASSGAMWQNVERQVLADNYNKYRKELSAGEIALFERVAGDTLQQLGYTLDYAGALSQALPLHEIEHYYRLNKQLKLEARLKQTPVDAAKRKKQEALLNKLKMDMENHYFNRTTGVEKVAAQFL